MHRESFDLIVPIKPFVSSTHKPKEQNNQKLKVLIEFRRQMSKLKEIKQNYFVKKEISTSEICEA